MSDILDECRAPIPYVESYNGERVDADAVRDTLDDAANEIERLRAALKRIAANTYGLQGIIEDYSHDTNSYNFHAMEYWCQDAMRRKAIAKDALAPLADPNSVQSGKI